MPKKILMPALSPTMEHGNLAKWLKKEGDLIEPGEVIAEIETDKATMEIEAVDDGIITKILIPEGAEEIAVNTLIAVMLEEDESKDGLDDFIAKNSQSVAIKEESLKAQIKKEESPKAQIEKAEISSMPEISTSARSLVSDRIFASPLAKRVAKIENISLSSVIGTGPHGRIIKADVLDSMNNKRGRIARNPQEFNLLENNNMRKVIAKRLLESKQTIPHFYLTLDCIMDDLLAARVEINKLARDDKQKRVSVNDFVILASAKALKDVPEANASWGSDAIKMYNNIDLCVAVAIDGGLVTPIIKNADQKSIKQISVEMKDLAKRARDGELKPEEYKGGGFSISNLGMFGVKNFNAIINPPQSCILAVGKSDKRAVVINDSLQIRTVMDITLSCDHRAVDGAVGARFLTAFKKYIEAPILMFI